jgi:tetratricopeptide (TPR) repeat protein/tRNA A-37 threonylcarbamoyl transferase component Bud32
LSLPTPDTVPQPYLPYYEVIEPLGEGAVATVYRVRSARDGSTFALKSLKPEQATTDIAIKRFEDEFRILSRLHHPSLPEVFDYGITAGDTRYIVMEIVDGAPLNTYFGDHKDDFWLLVYQLTEALSFIHEHNLLHLDLKPGNVLVKRTRAYGDSDMPMAMLIDFGLSYQRAEGGKAKMIGTPDYMPPEIIRGDENPTRAADYYSLGCILFEMVEGRVPFSGKMDDKLRGHLRSPVKFSKRKVEYASLYPWIEKLMAKEPNERLAAFGEFRQLVGERVAGSVDGLERAYAMGFIESLGLFAKRRIWSDVEGWARGVVPAATRPVAEPVARATEEETIDLAVTPDLEDRIHEDLLSVAAVPPAEVEDPAKRQRYLNVSGPPESGKAFLVRTLRDHLVLGGGGVVTLDDPHQYRALVASADKSRSSDPRAVAAERLVAGWVSLAQMTNRAGGVVLVEHAESLPSEVREFLEYAIKRCELALSEGNEPGVFIVVASESPSFKKHLCELVTDDNTCGIVEIPPPNAEDIDTIVDEFHGHMSGAAERRSLASYLSGNLSSDGAVMTSLRHAVAEQGLRYHGGTWEFHGVAGDRQTDLSSASYYRELLSDLPEPVQAVVQWLSCHRGYLDLELLSQVSGIEQTDVVTALDALRPFRFVEIVTAGEHNQARFVSDDVREVFHRDLDEADRQSKHEAFIEHVEGDNVESIEALIFHCEHADRRRDALRHRAWAIQFTKQQGDVFAWRRLCDGGIRFAEGVDEEKLLQRFFIKERVNADWSVSNYAGIVRTIEEQFTAQGQKVPVSFLYKYAYAVQSSGDGEKCETILRYGQDRIESRTCESFHHLLVIAGVYLESRRDYEQAVDVLKSVNPLVLNRSVLSLYYVTMMMSHEWLGHSLEKERYRSLGFETAQENQDFEHLLRIHYDDAMASMNRGRLAETRSVLRSAIRLANRQKMYRNLSTFYYLSSGVYYEEGHFDRALSHLDKAIRIGTDIGLQEHVRAYVARRAAGYRNVGRYGTAIRQLQTIAHHLPDGDDNQFYANLIILEIYLFLNAPQADIHLQKVQGLANEAKFRYGVGVYHQLAGDYWSNRGSHDQAVPEYEQAVRVFDALSIEDDATRARIRLAVAYAGVDLAESCRLTNAIKKHVSKQESLKVLVEFEVLRSNYARRVADKPAVKTIAQRLEDLSHRPQSVQAAMFVDNALFLSYRDIGEVDLMLERFKHYYTRLKSVCSDLPASLLEGFTRNPDFLSMLEVVKSSNKKSPN